MRVTIAALFWIATLSILAGQIVGMLRVLQENTAHARRRTIEPSLVQGLVSCQKCGYALSRASARTSD